MPLLLSNFPPIGGRGGGGGGGGGKEEIKKKERGKIENEKMNRFEESLERWNDENLDSRVG